MPSSPKGVSQQKARDMQQCISRAFCAMRQVMGVAPLGEVWIDYVQGNYRG